MTEFIINPAFHRHPGEAILIGRLLAAFGELELEVCKIAAAVMPHRNSIMKVLYRLRSTSSRLEAADALIRPICEMADVVSDYEIAISMVFYCLRIRNQFAHCNWGDDERVEGLFFADLQESAAATTGFNLIWNHVNSALLEEEERFFACTIEWLRYVEDHLAVTQGRQPFRVWPKPPEQAKPPLHNPPAEHIPPWLDADQRDLLGRAPDSGVGGR